MRCVVAFKQSAAGVGHAVVVGVEPHTPAPEQVGVYAVRDVPVAQIEAGVGHAVVVGVEPHTPAPEQVGVYAVRDVPTQIEAGVEHELTAGDSSTTPLQSSSRPLHSSVLGLTLRLQTIAPAVHAVVPGAQTPC